MSAAKGRDNSYKSILKGVSVFGGVQVFQILINLVRGKFVALFLGPEGMGIASLFTTSSTTLQRLSSLGLNLAIVKETAERSEDESALAVVKGVASRLVTFTSLLGALVCFIAAPWLSRLSFGTDSYRWQFMLLAVAVFFSVAGAGKLSLLQGLHEVKRLSKASVVGALTGLLGGVPLYYFFGTAGIVPAMIVLAVAMWGFYSWQLRKSVALPSVKFTRREHGPLAKKLIALGLVLMASDLIGSLCNYLLNVYLRSEGSYDAVGLYQAANSLTNQYTNMVFAAMSLDYFPRLSACVHNDREMTSVVNHQSEIIALIITPLVILFVAAAPLVIDLLLTSKFASIAPLLRWMGLGVLLKAFMFPTGYIAFAKDNKRLFFWLEGVGGNLLTLLLGCAGFHFFGIIGMGYALIADSLICLMVYLIVNGALYHYRMTRSVALYYAGGLLMSAAAVGVTFIPSSIWASATLIALILISGSMSFLQLRKLLAK